MDGATWTANATVRSAPRPVRPRTRYAATSIAAHALIRIAGRGCGRPLMLSSTASVPASTVAEQEGTSAVQ